MAQPGGDLLDVERVLGDEDLVGTAGDARGDGDPADVVTHDLDDHDAVVRLRRGVHPVERLGGDADRGVEADRAVGAPDVVVDRLRGADHPDTGLGELPGGREGAVAADADERLDVLVPNVSRTESMPPLVSSGWNRAVPSIVPPWLTMPRAWSRVSGNRSPSTTPRQPWRNPTRVSPCRLLCLTTARIKALSPGQSPPPVRSPMRMSSTLRSAGSGRPVHGHGVTRHPSRPSVSARRRA